MFLEVCYYQLKNIASSMTSPYEFPWQQDENLKTPGLKAAEARVAKVQEEIRTNELIKAINALIEEVRVMPIASRFSPNKRVGHLLGDSNMNGLNPAYRELSEAEFKRQQLISDLISTKDQALRAAADLGIVIMDIEATKAEG
jgi:hypothetical protein